MAAVDGERMRLRPLAPAVVASTDRSPVGEATGENTFGCIFLAFLAKRCIITYH